MSNLVSTATLEADLNSEWLVVFDASWHLPAPGQPVRNAREEYLDCHIPGAIFADIDELSDQQSSLPHMLSSASAFEAQMRSLGMYKNSQVVVYDTHGLFSAARLWWMLRTFGHDQVRVLDGGLPKWIEESRRVASGEVTPSLGDFTGRYIPSRVASLDEIHKAELVLDARSAGRFQGVAPEPRPGLPSGHMPNARNLPFDRLIRDARLRSREELKEIFAEVGVRDDQPIITSCGSGVTAAIISLALAEVGHCLNSLYDGSWTEYAQKCPSEVVTDEVTGEGTGE